MAMRELSCSPRGTPLHVGGHFRRELAIARKIRLRDWSAPAVMTRGRLRASSWQSHQIPGLGNGWWWEDGARGSRLDTLAWWPEPMEVTAQVLLIASRRDGAQKKGGSKNEGISHDVIENKWRKNVGSCLCHDVDENKCLILINPRYA